MLMYYLKKKFNKSFLFFLSWFKSLQHMPERFLSLQVDFTCQAFPMSDTHHSRSAADC